MNSLTEIRWREVPCALCGADRPRPLAESRAYAVRLVVTRCGACRHVYLNPRPVTEDLPRLYGADYYTGSKEEGAYTYDDERRYPETARIRAGARLARIETLVPPGRLLDVGCSFGALLAAAEERGWVATGVDISPYAVRACREAGLDVVMGSLETAGIAPASRDAVHLSETVEHLPDPRATVGAAVSALRPGGILVLATANHDSLARLLRGDRWGYYMPGHLQYFSMRSLFRLLTEEGLTVVRRRFGDDRPLPALRAGRRAAGRRAGMLGSFLDLLLRISLGPFSVGAGMILYGRKEP